MLGTVIKHEWKSTWKMLAILNGLTVIMAILGRIGSIGHKFIPDLIQGLYITFYILAIAASSIVTMILLVIRFYRNIFTEQGYLTNTLPITTTEKLNGKLINFLIWNIINVCCIVLSIFIFVFRADVFRELVHEGIPEMLKDMTNTMGFSSPVLLVLYWVGYFLVSTISSILMFYFCISIGCSFNKNKVLASVLTYVILHMVQVVVGVILILAVGAADDLMRDTNDFGILMIYNNVNFILTGVMAAAYYLVTHYMMRKKLNLN